MGRAACGVEGQGTRAALLLPFCLSGTVASIAKLTGTLDLRAAAPTLRVFVDDSFNPLYRSKFLNSGQDLEALRRLLRQGPLNELGEKRVDAAVRSGPGVHGAAGQAWHPGALAGELAADDPGRPGRNGVLETMPELPRPPPPGRKPRLAAILAEALRGKLPAARVVLNQSGRTPSRQAVWTEPHAL